MTRGLWIEIEARVDNEAVEAVSELFQRYAHGGVVIEYPTEPGAEIAWNEEAVVDRTRPIAVRGYLPSNRDGRRRQRQIEEAVWHLARIWPIEGPTVRDVREEDWANAWKEHFHAHRIGERIVIKPTWREYDPGPDDLVISLDPGMAFGTGLHPTTQLCLRALERIVKPGDRVLDVGTGSGILALAAARLGASAVFAVDLDGVAIEAAWSNVDANSLRDLVHVRHGDAADLPEAGTFDVVVANIIARVIAASAAALARQLRPGGTLVASGILRLPQGGARGIERGRPGRQDGPQGEEGLAPSPADDVTAALEAAGIKIDSVDPDGDWCALIGTRR